MKFVDNQLKLIFLSDLVDESVSKERLLGTTPQLSNCKQIMQDQNGKPI